MVRASRPGTRSASGRNLIGRGSAPATRGRHIEEQGKHSGRSAVAEGISLILAIVAVAMWASPLSSQLGAGVWDTAVRLALPLTFALQWIMWSRHLEQGRGPRGPCATRDLPGASCLLELDRVGA